MLSCFNFKQKIQLTQDKKQTGTKNQPELEDTKQGLKKKKKDKTV